MTVFDWVNPPVVDNEFQLRDFTVAISNFGVCIEGLAHDGNKHIQKCQQHDEVESEEENQKDGPHGVHVVGGRVEVALG